MGWFKKLTGVSSKGIVQAAGAAAGAYFGGPQGAQAGYSLGGALTGDTSGLSNLVQGAVGLGTDYLQSQVNLAAQKSLAKYTAEQQNALNEQAFQRNLQQWNMENAYNSPAEQMKRFEAAGLNKNLIYGQQNTSANSPTLQPATYDPGQYHPVDKSAQRQALQLALLEHKARIENQAIENDLARQRIALAERDADRSDALARAQISAIHYSMAPEDINPKNTPPDRRSWLGKIIDDISGKLYNKAFEGGKNFFNWNEEQGYNKKALQYKDGKFHKFVEYVRNF